MSSNIVLLLLWTSFWSRVFRQIVGFFIELRTLRSKDATATRTSLKQWICVLSLFSTHLLFQLQANLPGVEFLRTISKFRKKKKIYRCLELLFTFSIVREIRHFQDVVVQTRQRNVEKKCDSRAKLLFVQIRSDMNTYLADESGFPSSTTTEDCALSLSSGRCPSLWADASPELEGFSPAFFNDTHPQASLKLKRSEFFLKNCREIFNNGNTIKAVKTLLTFTQKKTFLEQ